MSARIDDGSLYLNYSDDGAGMEQSVLNQIFEPFYTTKASGTGLGMAWVYQILRAQNGTIHIKKSTHDGAAMWLRMPLADGMITESQIDAFDISAKDFTKSSKDI